MFISGDLGIRPVEEQDLGFLQFLRNDPATWINLSDIEMLTSHGQKEWFSSISRDKSKKYFIIFKDNNRYDKAGMVRCDEIDYINHSIRIGADISKDYRGQGLGTKAYKLLLEYCFNYLNMNRVWLLVLDYNHIAKRLYANVGFQEEGRMRQAIYRDGAYHDYIVMSILKENYATL